MKLLEEIARFPAGIWQALQARSGIDSAESFYAHAVQNPAGLGQALDLRPSEVERLSDPVAGHLPADYIVRCKAPREHRPRGPIVERR